MCVVVVLLSQVAKTMAPSVIYIDEVEKVFVSDKKKAKEFGGQVRMHTAVCDTHTFHALVTFLHMLHPARSGNPIRSHWEAHRGTHRPCTVVPALSDTLNLLCLCKVGQGCRDLYRCLQPST
jgi:hypothetical protein